MTAYAAQLAARTNWQPTSKWWAATVIAIGGILTTLATQNWQWSPAYAGAVITIVTQRVVAYLVPNEDPAKIGKV